MVAPGGLSVKAKYSGMGYVILNFLSKKEKDRDLTLSTL